MSDHELQIVSDSTVGRVDTISKFGTIISAYRLGKGIAGGSYHGLETYSLTLGGPGFDCC